MDDEYWAAYRKHARQRANAWGALIICPFIIAMALLAFTGPTDHPIGDIRDNIVFRIAFYGLFGAGGVAGLIGSVRWLLADRRGAR